MSEGLWPRLCCVPCILGLCSPHFHDEHVAPCTAAAMTRRAWPGTWMHSLTACLQPTMWRMSPQGHANAAARLYTALLMATRTRKEKSEQVHSPGDARALVRAVVDAPPHHTRPSRAHRLVPHALQALYRLPRLHGLHPHA